ncbi:hypothetical protein ACFWIJ_36445, partial [Streptomyces sp. NPDC127079]
CGSLANAASDSDRMLDSAQWALCSAHAPAGTAAAPAGHAHDDERGPDDCRVDRDHPEPTQRHL